MKIIEAQSALLSNYEVYQFLVDRNEQLAREKPRRRGPGNLNTVVKEILQFFAAPYNPLGQAPITYSPGAIRRLIERLRPYDLTKGELIMVLNLRPSMSAHLHACIEELENRLTEDQQQEMLDIVAEVLGPWGEDGKPNGNAPAAQDAQQNGI